MNAPGRNPALWLIAAGVVLAVVAFCVIPFFWGQPGGNAPLLALSIVSAGIWVLVLWWATHHLVYQLASLALPRSVAVSERPKHLPKFLVLYLTCDDFLPECGQSCLAQDYPR
jgi:hypothetical protein